MSESRVVKFGSNLPQVEVCKCQFSEHSFETDDPEKIKRLRDKQPSGDGVMIWELKGKEAKPGADIEITQVGVILQEIGECKNAEALDKLVVDIGIKYPADSFGPAQKEKIANAVKAKGLTFKVPAVPAGGKNEKDEKKSGTVGKGKKGPKASKKKTPGKKKKGK